MIVYTGKTGVPIASLPGTIEWEGNRLAVEADTLAVLKADAAEVLGETA